MPTCRWLSLVEYNILVEAAKEKHWHTLELFKSYGRPEQKDSQAFVRAYCDFGGNLVCFLIGRIRKTGVVKLQYPVSAKKATCTTVDTCFKDATTWLKRLGRRYYMASGRLSL